MDEYSPKYPGRQVRIARKEAVGMDTLVKAWIKANRLTGKVNTQRIFSAWDAVSGAAPYTIRRYYRSGTLYITLSSAVIRSRLIPRRQEFIDKINLMLSSDTLFTQGDKYVGLVDNLILK